MFRSYKTTLYRGLSKLLKEADVFCCAFCFTGSMGQGYLAILRLSWGCSMAAISGSTSVRRRCSSWPSSFSSSAFLLGESPRLPSPPPSPSPSPSEPPSCCGHKDRVRRAQIKTALQTNRFNGTPTELGLNQPPRLQH